MRFSFSAVLALVAPALVAAQTSGFSLITKPSSGETVPAGSRYDIVWEPSSAHPGAVTLALLGGASAAVLSVITTIAKGVDGSAGSFAWQVPSDVGNLAVYGIRITLDSDTSIFQYSFPFKIGGSNGGGKSTVPAPVTSSTPKPDPPTSSSPAPKPPTSSNSPDTSVPTSAASSSIPGPPPTVISSTSSGSSPTTTASDRDRSSSRLSGSTTLTSGTTTSESATQTATGAAQELAGTSSGLSSGAIAGIAVGVILAALVIAAVAFLVVYRRRRRPHPGDGPDPSVGELDDDPRGPPDTAELAAEKGVKDVPELATEKGVKDVPELAVGAAAIPAVPEMSGESPARRVPELGGSVVTAPAELAQDSASNNGPAPSVEISPAEVPTSSSPITNHPAAPADQAVGDLLARQSRLDERRQRLLELEEIDQERDAIQRQISVLQQQQQQPVQRYEMGG